MAGYSRGKRTPWWKHDTGTLPTQPAYLHPGSMTGNTRLLVCDGRCHLINMTTNKILPTIESFILILHIVGFFAVLIQRRVSDLSS